MFPFCLTTTNLNNDEQNVLRLYIDSVGNLDNKTKGEILKNVKDAMWENVYAVLSNDNLIDEQKVSKLTADYKLSNEEVKVIREKLKNGTEMEIISYVVDERSEQIKKELNTIKNETAFVKDFMENNKKLTNYKLTLNEDDFVSYSGNSKGKEIGGILIKSIIEHGDTLEVNYQNNTAEQGEKKYI